MSLDQGWFTIATDSDRVLPHDLYKATIDKAWKQVNVPHNWDGYEGYRRLLHGNRHGDAWYRKTFIIHQPKKGKRFFLFFEGVSSYATVFVNGKKAGEHAGGRTTFTIDITNLVKTDGSNNQLDVLAHHPSGIKDLPWVCGGCSDERGFSEGSQPMGIFRPVHLIVTNDARIEPFGVHAWSDISDDKTLLHIDATLKNYSSRSRKLVVTNQLVDAKGKIVAEISLSQLLGPGDSIVVSQKDISVDNPSLWSPASPYLYHIVTIIKEGNTIIDRMETDFGFRTINWKTPSHQFFINGKPFFINGIAGYEHLLGQSHAFSDEQIQSRIKWIKAAGFNAFRDAHQPHNLLYGQLCNEEGLLWWTQLSAHIWYDTPEFRDNFKKLLRDWVIERRNDPSVILWGLQNESQLPEDFAKECTELIRQLDPTTSSQRLVTTCNGGTGTDWDVPQNWTGTYGGNPATYADDLKRQMLVGEYGAWRTIDLHTEGPFVQNGVLSEDRMVQLMEQKLRLAESVKDSVAGHFFWLLSSHDNPGRVQGGEGLRELDRVGPVNYKGMLTPWEEPLDVYYMFRSNYAPKNRDPMLYIVSHTWPGRWLTTGRKDGIIVYSNCDEVELFNDVNDISLGKKRRAGIGIPFRWDDVPINYDILYAVGYVNGKAVAKDTVVLHYLPKSPHFERLYTNTNSITKGEPGYNYIYRINCGGPQYKDENGNTWQADQPLPSIYNSQSTIYDNYWGSLSWTNDFPGMPAFFGSQRRTFSPVKGTRDWKLFQDFRYGKDKLRYEFPLPDGKYRVEFYFIEPWLGVGGGIDAAGMRLFDIAINGNKVLGNIDIWKTVGTNTALKRTVEIKISGGKMIISFLGSRAGQAIISAIAIASLNKNIKPAPSFSLIRELSGNDCKYSTWLDENDKQYSDAGIYFHSLPSNLYGADWLQFSKNKKSNAVYFTVTQETDVYIGIDSSQIQTNGSVQGLEGYENTATWIETTKDGMKKYLVFRKRYTAGSKVSIPPAFQQIVILQPATSMQPAYDLKKTKSYRMDVANVSEGIKKEEFNGRECAIIRSSLPVNIQWSIQTGVADIYSITIKYYNPGDTLRGRLQLIGPGNTMMMDEPVNFIFTRPGKWNSVTVNTGTMINAGNYDVKLVIENAEGLVVSGIDVQ